MQYNKVTQRDIEYLIELCGREHVYVKDEIHEDFTHDEMIIYGEFAPDVVLEPLNTEQVSQIMIFSNKNKIPVTPRGSGTGLCGGCVALYGGILLSLAKMDKIIEFDESNYTVTVEPGVLLMTLAQEAINRNMMYPPDPGEKSATIGGNVMTNAGGMRAIKYGVTRNYVMGMTVVLPNGSVIEIGGKVAKNSSGYSISDLIVGSEGTLGIVTRITLKLIPLPKSTISLLIPFDNLGQCFDTVPKILNSHTIPTAVEFMQRQVIEAAEKYLGLRFPDKSANAYLLLTFDGNSREELTVSYKKVAAICIENGAKDVFISDTEERQESIWKARGAFLEAIKTSTTEIDECDVVVPRSNLGKFIQLVNILENEHDVRIRSFGHAGDGNLHIYLCKDSLANDVWTSQCDLIMEKLYENSKNMGGQISGEHGIGHAKLSYLKKSLGEETIQLMKGIKKVFDPKNILNPGKICTE